ncbi:class I SAM-dependent methyltransferase [Paenibacillus sp. IB182496]|uniref:Class I SAM-dependent methyltransferase n=1 Tax=Paenibacillus sabuli TaxID=2772509 RepID=A0A927BXW0_9BACL|nr:class I SAM-dependent methyltransferase [Paenibacillus sabuli]MBD2847615.1 class I SAM-dependent methyltransferase [Paenibacillus sabuli]
MIVTTTSRPTAESVARARAVAEELGAAYAERGDHSLARLRRRQSCDRLLIVSEREVRYDDGHAPPFFFHPSMALVRIKRLLAGERDTLVAVSGCRPGDVVLDCTAGMAADAAVLAHAAGPGGRVTALESRQLPALLVREGLATYRTGLPAADAALRRVTLRWCDHVDELRRLPADSCDIVYFDPMFRRPIHESSALQPLRPVADDRPLSPQAIAEARRVARRVVVLKEHAASGEFERLGFDVRAVNHANTAYGVIMP